MTDIEFFEQCPQAPYRITDAGRVVNPALSRTLVTTSGKLRTLAATVRLIANYNYPVLQPIPNLVYEGPVLFDQPGTFILENRNIRSNDDTAAVRVWNGAKVEIRNCKLVSKGNVIEAAGNATLNVHHNDIYGDTPLNNGQYGRALNMYHPTALTFENNFVYHTGGILLDHTEPGSTPIVYIRYNTIMNTDKRRVDNTAGDHRASILFNTVLPVKGEIAWNYFINEMGISHVEDNINLYNSGGTSANVFDIHDNFIFGAYPYPLTADFYTGSGITIDGDPGTNQLNNMSQYVNIFSNQIVSTCNACMNIAAGHDIHSYDNTYISSGMFPDGTASQRFWGGCCIWDASNVGANFKNNTQKNNTIGYVRPDVNVPFAGRQDWVTVTNNPLSIVAGDNISLPNPVTLDTENAEFGNWGAKVVQANKVIGNQVGTNVPPVDTDPIPVTTGFTCFVGEILNFKVTAADDSGKDTGFKAGSLKVSSDILSLASNVSIDETILTILALKAGETVVTTTLATNGGKTLTKSFSIMITEELPEATQILITQIK